LSAERAEGPPRRLRGLLATDRNIPRAGMTVTRKGESVGVVTSGTFSPTRRIGIGLAFLDSAVNEGDEVNVDVRGRAAVMHVVRPPFVDASPR
jgi:aminomethyltransferase